MRYLPIGLLVEARDALVVGAAGEIVGKIHRLADAGARVTVLATEAGVDPSVAARAAAGELTLEARRVHDADLARAFVVFASPGDAALEARLFAWATSTGRLVCTLDRPASSTFVNPAIAEGSGLTAALASGGAAPGLLRRLREDLETVLADPRLAPFVDALRLLREQTPSASRPARIAAAVKGFTLEARLRFPAWFERGERAPAG